MSKFIDLTGQTFGYWKVIGLSSKGANKPSIWLCECTLCGKKQDVCSYSLTKGLSTKCRSCATSLSKTKSYSNDPIKTIFMGMKQRCYNSNSISYCNYGAKGITICDEWLNNPTSFYEWAYSNGYIKGLTIERNDVTKGYSPTNCCFISKSEQSKNRTISNMITIDDETKCLSDWCKIYNITRGAVRYRIKNGMSPEEAIKTPTDKSHIRRVHRDSHS